MNNSSIGEFLRIHREKKELSLRDLSKLAHVSHVHIKEIENGNRQPSFDLLIRLIRALGIGLEYFFTETGYIPRAPMHARGLKLRYVEVIHWEEAENKTKYTPPRHTHEEGASVLVDSDAFLFALVVIDDSMEPEFAKGDRIVIDPAEKTTPGDYVIAKNEQTKDTMLIQLKKLGTTFVLHPLNSSKYPDIELKRAYKGYRLFKGIDGSNYKIIGRVIKKEKDYPRHDLSQMTS